MATNQPPKANRAVAKRDDDISDLMGEMPFNVRLYTPEASLPQYRTPNSAWFDVFNASGFTRLANTGGIKTVRTGLAFEVPAGKTLMLVPHPDYERLAFVDGPIYIDATFRNEVVLRCVNSGPRHIDFADGGPVARGTLIDTPRWSFVPVSALAE